ncbi:putative N-acetyltransferase CML1 [Ctenodactylus gundi]
MAPYCIRKYKESDRKPVLQLFAQGMYEHVPATFRHMLRLPKTLLVIFGVPFSLLLISGSWLLAIMSSFTLLLFLWYLARYTWNDYVENCLRTDMADISKSYMSTRGSCFWVAESGGDVVGTVGALAVESPPLGKKQVELFHLSVSMKHRGEGIAKALVRTVLQFAREQGYNEVVLSTSILQHSALAVYQKMGFQNTGQFFLNKNWRLMGIPVNELIYQVPSQPEDM